VTVLVQGEDDELRMSTRKLRSLDGIASSVSPGPKHEGDTENGRGKITYPNGSAYDGEFVNSFIVQGTFTGKSGTNTSYKGSFKSHWTPVEGILISDGRKFKVSFREDCEAIANCIDSFIREIQTGSKCKNIKNIVPHDDDDKQSSEAPAARRQATLPELNVNGLYLEASPSREVSVTKQSPGQSKVPSFYQDGEELS
jgi:hypothetical protein